MSEQRTPAVVAVAGSCPTRDNFNSRFNPHYKRWFSCDLTSTQSSVIAMMSPPLETEWRPVGEMSDYDAWIVRSDFGRVFLPQLAELRPQYLLVDFFADLHFGVLRLPDGRYVTDNRWMVHRTDWYQEQSAAGTLTRLRIQDDPEGYFAIWREAMDRFAAEVARRCPETTVVVHRGWNTHLVRVPGRAEPVRMRRHKPVAPFDVALGNELWARLDDYCLDTFGWESIDLRSEAFTSYADHPWGTFWVHYEPEYYHRFLAELLKIDLRRSGVEPDLQDRIAEIEEARRESGDWHWRQAQALADSRAETVARQRQRIEQLESLGVGRAVRFAVGQRIRARRSADEEGTKP